MAALADEPTARPRNSNESVMNQSSSAGTPAIAVALRSTPRFKCRRRQPSSVSLRSSVFGASAGAAPTAATAASEIRGAFAAPSLRIVKDDALRAAGLTFTMLLRPARKPERCTRTRYGPGGNCFSV